MTGIPVKNSTKLKLLKALTMTKPSEKASIHSGDRDQQQVMDYRCVQWDDR